MFFLNGCTHVTREVQLFADRRREERCNLACVGGGAARTQFGALPAWGGTAWQGADPEEDDGELPRPTASLCHGHGEQDGSWQTHLAPRRAPAREGEGREPRRGSEKQQSGVSLGVKSEARQGHCFLSLWVR